MRRTDVKKVKEIIRLKLESDLSIRQIAANCGMSKSAVQDVLKRATENCITWPLTMTNQKLLATLYPPSDTKNSYPEPDVNWIQREMKKKHVTLMLLWEEYKSVHPEGLMYTQFCERYRQFKKLNQISMHKEHKAGEEMEVDWAGTTMAYMDRESECTKQAYLFVAVLPASRYPFVYAYPNMKLASWIDAHVRAFRYFGGVPKIIIPDNTKTATTKSDSYDPILNQTYSEMARHYHAAVVPARALRPKDKASTEGHVKITGQRIIAKLRNEQFFSLADLNNEISVQLDRIIHKEFQKIPETRQSLFEATDKLALQALPKNEYEFARWKEAKVQTNYHVEYDKYYYSVPFAHVGSHVSLRITNKLIEVYLDQERIGLHMINRHPYIRYTTLPEHMPEAHLATSAWSEKRFTSWAATIGPKTQQYIKGVLASKDFPEQSFKTCMGIMSLAKKHNVSLIEIAAEDAEAKKLYTYKYYSSIVKRLEKQGDETVNHNNKVIYHDNIRGVQSIVGGERHVN